MLSYKFKKNLLITLIATAILLLAANILLQRNSSDINKNNVIIREKNLSERLINIFSEFGIDEKYIKESKFVDKRSNQEIIKFKVQVPKDLSIPEILLDVHRSFANDSLTINSVERKKGGETKLEIKSGTLTLLQAEFDYSKNYARDKGNIAFIICDVSPANQSTIQLIESPTKLNFLVRPEKTTQPFLGTIRKNSQQYSILIDDDINEQSYKLGANYSEKRIITVLKTLVTEYKNAVCFIVDSKSDFYDSQGYEVFKRELLKRNIKLFTTSDFVYLVNDDNLPIVFKEEVDSLKNVKSKIFLLDEETFLVLSPEVLKYQKQGYRVIPSTAIFNKD
jgi:hypothetical protein